MMKIFLLCNISIDVSLVSCSSERIPKDASLCLNHVALILTLAVSLQFYIVVLEWIGGYTSMYIHLTEVSPLAVTMLIILQLCDDW
jgi:hypothetical protein